MIQLETLLHIEEVSKQIGINRYTIYKKIRENKFPKGVKLNGKRMFKPIEIKDYFSKLDIEANVN